MDAQRSLERCRSEVDAAFAKHGDALGRCFETCLCPPKVFDGACASDQSRRMLKPQRGDSFLRTSKQANDLTEIHVVDADGGAVAAPSELPGGLPHTPSQAPPRLLLQPIPRTPTGNIHPLRALSVGDLGPPERAGSTNPLRQPASGPADKLEAPSISLRDKLAAAPAIMEVDCSPCSSLSTRAGSGSLARSTANSVSDLPDFSCANSERPPSRDAWTENSGSRRGPKTSDVNQLHAEPPWPFSGPCGRIRPPALDEVVTPSVVGMSVNVPEVVGSARKGASFSPLSRRKTAVVERQLSRLHRFTKSTAYELVNASIIVLNAIFVVCETEQRAVSAAAIGAEGSSMDGLAGSQLATAAHYFFCAIFTLDLGLRIAAEKRRFFRTRDLGWNVLDIFVVFTSMVEVCAGASSGVSMILRKFSMIRIWRLLRVIRVTRALRMIQIIRELRLMVYLLTGSLKPLFWAVLLLFVVLLFFAIFLTDGAVTYCVQHNAFQAAATQDLLLYFGTLSRSTLTLFMSMSGGEDWAQLLRALGPLSWEYHLFFMVFICFALLALLNVVTAVFIQTAMERSQNDREFMIQQELGHKCEFTAIMRQVFEELDTNSSGALSLREFEKHIDDEMITAYLKSLQVDVGQIRSLFTLLDVDQTGEVDVDEFVSGCVRLKGGATSMDMAILKYEVEFLVHNMVTVQQSIERLLVASHSGNNNNTVSVAAPPDL